MSKDCLEDKSKYNITEVVIFTVIINTNAEI